jgi:hypothetical protein
MAGTLAAPRCASCQRGLAFDEWSVGLDVCSRCVTADAIGVPAATYTPSARQVRATVEEQQTALERMLDEMPDALIDELVAALEAEAAKDAAAPAGSPLREILDEIGFRKSPKEATWAVWGFAAGFAGNVLVAKYAQMSAGAPMSALIGPLLLGGLVAGATCAAIGWGLARLRDR